MRRPLEHGRGDSRSARPWLTAGALALGALLGAPAAGAQTCEAPPGTSGIDQYCESVPGPGGEQGPGDKQQGPGATREVREQLERAGPLGSRLSGLVSKRSGRGTGRSDGGPPRSGDDEDVVSAIQASAGGSALPWILLALTAGALIAALLGVRARRT